MEWEKLGLVFCPEGNYPWMMTHAANPFARRISENIYRIYFTCRNAENLSHIGFADVDMNDHFKVVHLAEDPVLSPGEPGMFDDSGTAMGYMIDIGGKTYLYYLGWNLKVTVPWLNTIGLAVFDTTQNKFVKYSRAPIMDRSHEDPFSVSYPSILADNGIYRMWYGSNLAWGKEQHEMKHVIKYAESQDGLQWNRTGKIVVDLEHPGEYALSKPFVIKDKDNYKMWYSYRGSERGDTYRIGMAVSSDGENWIRKDDEAGIDVSDTGWDSGSIEYPCVFSHNGTWYMLYNGNDYGRTGFGIAVFKK